MQKFILVLLGVVVHSLLVNAFISPMRAHVRRTQQLNMVDFGKTNYKGFEDWCSGYAEDQKEKWPTYFVLPEGVYEVQLQKPLGIVFEEVEADGRKGCFVSELVPDGNAEKAGVGVGDLLLATTGVKVRGAKFDRPLIQVSLRVFFSILVVSCVIWSGALDSSDVLLSHSTITPASHITTILISTLKHSIKKTYKHLG